MISISLDLIVSIKYLSYCNIDYMFLLQQASQGKVSKELLNRLMSILGHLIQLRTLKVFKLDKRNR